MIQTTKTYENVGNVTGERINLRVDEAALSHIMDVVTNLYSDPIMAIVREYSTNALDSHILEGQTRPIEVTLPNGFAPSFKVKDWGVGLSAADMQEVYSLYGASTKRTSNDFTGMLGLGCKSALAYSTQFTVVGVKDGVKTVCLVKRDDDGSGSLTIVSEARTDEPNSVEVSVPSSDHGDFEQAAHDLFQYWEPGTVKVNGRDPEFVWDKCHKVTEAIYVQPEVHYGRVTTAVMGGVPYEVGMLNLRRLGNVIIKAPIGSFDFAPSREAVRDTELTREWITQTEQEVMDYAAAYIKRALLDHSDIEAWRAAALMGRSWGFEPKPTPDGCALTISQREVVVTYSLDYRGELRRTRSGADLLLGGKSMVVVSECQTNPTKQHADRIAKHFTDAKMVVFLAEQFGPHSLVANVVTYADVMKATRKQAVRQQRTVASELTYFQLGEGPVTAAELAASTDPLWFTRHKHLTDLAQIGGRTIYVPSTRLAKFKRLFPDAKPFEEEYARWKQRMLDSIPEEQRLRHGMSSWTMRELIVLDEDALDDPELVRAVKIAKQPPLDAAMLAVLERHMSLPDKFTAMIEARYPLLNSRYPKHSQTYANAIYQSNKREETI